MLTRPAAVGAGIRTVQTLPVTSLSQGEHPKVVQERLGHATVSITMDVYTHAIPALQREAADRLGALLG